MNPATCSPQIRASLHTASAWHATSPPAYVCKPMLSLHTGIQAALVVMYSMPSVLVGSRSLLPHSWCTALTAIVVGVCMQNASQRVITFANANDYISFRHHTFQMPRGAKSCAITECGPRFELKPYQIKLGTMDQDHAENEWALRAYMRSSKKAKLSETTELE